MKKIIIDTNAYAYLFRNNGEVLAVIDSADAVFISVVVLAELYTGFRGGSKYQQNIEDLNEFLADPVVSILDINKDTAVVFSQLKHTLKQNGSPLPINDIWLASQSIETGAILVTFDSHFKLIPGLRLWENIN